MSKHLLEDMVRVKHQRKEIFKKYKPKEKRIELKENGIKEMRRMGEIKGIETKYTRNRSRYMLWSLALISVIFCLFAFSFLFSRAEVVINPKIKDIVVNENLSASKDSNNNGLFFDLVVISGEENTIVKSLGEKDVLEKATGNVVIYNTFSSSSQGLDIDTRLEGSNGKIYKTQTKTNVPGMNKDGTPGSVEVKIYGEKAGEEYNSTPLDFKIFGFKGTPKYSKFYARSKGDIAGGFKGKVPAVSEADKSSALANLKDTLKKKLSQKVTSQVPSGFILYEDAVFLNTNDSDSTSIYNKDNTTTLTQKGTLYGLLFNEEKLTKKIVKNNIDKYDDSDVYISNIKNLIFSLPTGQVGFSDKDNISFDNIKNINFNLSGPAKVVWKLDINKFTTDLLGKSKKDFSQILSQYQNIDSAKLTLNFMWKMSIPDNTKDIKIIVNYPK